MYLRLKRLNSTAHLNPTASTAFQPRLCFVWIKLVMNWLKWSLFWSIINMLKVIVLYVWNVERLPKSLQPCISSVIIHHQVNNSSRLDATLNATFKNIWAKLLMVFRPLPPNHLIPIDLPLGFFFFWWGLLHGPQQGPDRMKEKNLKDWEKENSCLKQKNPPWKNHSLRNWPTLARAQAKSVSEEQTEKGLTL